MGGLTQDMIKSCFESETEMKYEYEDAQPMLDRFVKAKEGPPPAADDVHIYKDMIEKIISVVETSTSKHDNQAKLAEAAQEGGEAMEKAMKTYGNGWNKHMVKPGYETLKVTVDQFMAAREAAEARWKDLEDAAYCDECGCQPPHRISEYGTPGNCSCGESYRPCGPMKAAEE